jgi:hypothetical protein
MFPTLWNRLSGSSGEVRAQPRQRPSPIDRDSRTRDGHRAVGIMPEMAQNESLPSSSMRHSSAAVEDDDNERDPHIPGSIPPWVHISSSEDDTLIPPPVRPNTIRRTPAHERAYCRPPDTMGTLYAKRTTPTNTRARRKTDEPGVDGR